jgi:hypothetical protein
MPTNRFNQLATAACLLATLSTVGCAKKEKVADTALPRAMPVATTAPKPAASDPVFTVPVAIAADPASATWADIKDLTYETRAHFFAGLKQLEARVDEQVSELTAKRAAMKGTTDTKDWDFAMKEMSAARSYLKSTGEELGNATRETWDQQKDKVGLAWVRTQDAYAKVKSSTTN